MNRILNDTPSAIHEILTTYTSEELREISIHGCVSGVAHSHIYYTETSEFYDRWEEEILEFIDNVTGENPIQRHSSDIGTIGELKNHIVWQYIELLASVHSPN